MADSRILHRAAGDSEKVAALSDLEYRVWTQYVLSADDFGVMLAQAVTLQSDNRNLRKRPAKAIQKALEAVITAGLVLTFNHQGERYVWQGDWNDRQQIRYPRASVRPLPEDWTAATAATVKLFRLRTEKSPQDSGEVSETSQTPASAGGRETQTLTLTPPPTQAQTPAPTRQRKRAELQPVDGFDVFWTAYPLKVAKQDAIAAWNKLAPSEALQEFIGAALIWQRPSLTFEQDGQVKGTFPATWLNGRRWEDERPTALTAKLNGKPLLSVADVKHMARQLGPRSWAAECVNQHGGTCGDPTTHDSRMAVAS